MVLKGVAIVYGVSFVAGLVLAFDDITPQSNPNVYPLLALVAEAPIDFKVTEQLTTLPRHCSSVGTLRGTPKSAERLFPTPSVRTP